MIPIPLTKKYKALEIDKVINFVYVMKVINQLSSTRRRHAFDSLIQQFNQSRYIIQKTFLLSSKELPQKFLLQKWPKFQKSTHCCLLAQTTVTNVSIEHFTVTVKTLALLLSRKTNKN